MPPKRDFFESWGRNTPVTLAHGRHRFTLDDFMTRADASAVGQIILSPEFSILVDEEEEPEQPVGPAQQPPPAQTAKAVQTAQKGVKRRSPRIHKAAKVPKVSEEVGSAAAEEETPTPVEPPTLVEETPTPAVKKTNIHRFELMVYPAGVLAGGSTHVGVYLTSKGLEPVRVKFVISVQKADKSLWSPLTAAKQLSKDQKVWGYQKAFSRAVLSANAPELLPRGRLTIVCDLEIISDCTSALHERPRLALETAPPSIGDDISALVADPKFSDVSLVCGERVFPSHRVVLAARSDVFAAMFSHRDTAEDAKRKVDVVDVEGDVMGLMLQFVYSDTCEIKAENVVALMTAADKYNLRGLRCACEEFVCGNLEVGSVGEMLLLADLLQAKRMRRVIMEFVLDHLKEVTESAGWAKVCEANPKIWQELVFAREEEQN